MTRDEHGPRTGDIQEKQKRKREILALIPLGLLFLVLTWIEFQLFGYSQSLPFVHSVFFFGLVNFNIVILLLLLFLIFRNIVKVFAEKQGGVMGSTLKGKLIAAFVAFSTIPTILMFLISVFYINSSFDKWFNEKISGVLKSALEVTNAYVLSAKKKNYHFANQIATELKRQEGSDTIRLQLSELREKYRLDAVEFYPSLFGERLIEVSRADAIPEVPRASMEFLQKGIEQGHEGSTLHHFAEGNLVRVIVPVANKGAVVVSSYIPMSLLAKMDAIMGAYEDFRDLNPIEYPLKSIYLIILILMTLVILLAATWFGFYLARQLSVPLERLGEATKRLAKGDYQLVEATAGSAEMGHLIESFNSMTRQLETSEREVLAANRTLQETLERLDEHSKYIEVVLSNASTGVVSVDERGIITMVNHHAAELLEIEPSTLVGKKAKDVLSPEYYGIFDDLLRSMKQHNAVSIEKEVHINVNGRTVPLRMTLSVLYDDNKRELGKVLVFDDLTPILSAQRAAAWTEVARRIAHEIKNPLTPIKLAAQRLEKKFGTQIEDSAFKESIHMIIEQVDDMKTLVNEFSSFARMPKSNPQVGDLNKVIQEAMVLFKTGERGQRLTFQPDEELPRFRFDHDQLKRAVTNLIDNALGATQRLSHPRVDVQTEFDPLLKIVRLTVADNGEGINRQMRSRIFEPYVTTKEQGTGLGLAIVKRTIEDHNGFIRALPNQPRGTKMVIELPVIEVDHEQSMVRTLVRREEQGI
ncbi:MAG: PAS domain-containing protein [Bdellovibrionaceae bacterium]|nr:PAS domain-containing protein [Bdellovibrionales bacterium]MCB9084691.1 PAS domain-containing protein [Pseudobdellovibrionaceae bacterium]